VEKISKTLAFYESFGVFFLSAEILACGNGGSS
jgi:hypothetical protein